MAIKDLCEGDLFELRGKLWEVINFSIKALTVRSENGEISALPRNAEILVEIQ